MVAPTQAALSRATALTVAGWMAAGALACATSKSPEVADSWNTETVTDVIVEHGFDGASVVTLVGLDDPVYTAYFNRDPDALVLDLSAVDAEPAEPVVVYDGVVEQVTVSTFALGESEPMTRVEIGLAADADYDVIPAPTGLEIRVRAAGAQSAMDDSGLDDLQADEGDPWEDPDAELAGAPLEPMEAPEVFDAPPVAAKLEGVTVSKTESGALVHLQADGTIESMESFTLEDPARLVIDLPQLESSARERTNVDSDWVARVRVGAHPDKVRVVIDGGPLAQAFEGRQLMPSEDGLFVAVGAGEDLDQALAQAMQAASDAHRGRMMAMMEAADVKAVADDLAAADDLESTDDGWLESADDGGLVMDAGQPLEGELVADPFGDETASPDTAVAGGSVTVYGIHYDSAADRDRVAVLSDSIVDYTLHTPDEETVVVSIYDAHIAKEAEGRIGAAPGGPISLISAFQQPDVDRAEVRVVVKRAPNLDPQITPMGTMLFLDFPNTGVAARVPPVLDELGGESMAATDAVGPDASAGSELRLADAAAQLGAASEDPLQLESGSQPAPGTSLQTLPDEAALDVLAPAAVDFGAGADAAPASLEPPAAVEILQEGGLIDGKQYTGRRISLDFKDVEVSDVLRLIAEVSDLNIIAGDEVEGTVTIRLVDVPWDQALDVILLTKGLGFVRIGNVLRIAPADILQAEEEVRLQERRNKEKLEDLQVKLQPVNYADVNEMSELVKRLLTARGTVNVDERTNTLIIKDIASVIDEATALVQAVDTQTPQVVIEAKIVEANLDFSRELGSIWGFGSQPFADGFDTESGPARDLGGEDFRFHNANNVASINPITSLENGIMNLNAFLLDEQLNVNVQIQAAESTGDGKVISSPRVVTLDNRKAEIRQGVSIPFQTFEGGDAKLEFIDAVLSLMVTPHITSDQSIIMEIEVTRNAPDATVPTPTGSPAIAKNETKTETLVKDGQTLVIGGIYTIEKSERHTHVPYLHRLPILGPAFQAKEVTDRRKELLIFVTPRVVVAPAVTG